MHSPKDTEDILFYNDNQAIKLPSIIKPKQYHGSDLHGKGIQGNFISGLRKPLYKNDKIDGKLSGTRRTKLDRELSRQKYQEKVYTEIKAKKSIAVKQDDENVIKRNMNIDVPARYNTIQIKQANNTPEEDEQIYDKQYSKFVKKELVDGKVQIKEYIPNKKKTIPVQLIKPNSPKIIRGGQKVNREVKDVTSNEQETSRTNIT